MEPIKKKTTIGEHKTELGTFGKITIASKHLLEHIGHTVEVIIHIKPLSHSSDDTEGHHETDDSQDTSKKKTENESKSE